MIVTVTLNPLLERRYSFEGFNVHGNNRNGKVSLQAGGKGINVSRQLNHLNTDSLALTFLGGANGRQLRDLLKSENINFTSVRILSESRDGVVIVDEKQKNVTSLFGSDPDVTDKEVEEFKLKLEKIIQNCEIVIFSGSSPCKNTDSVIPFGIEMANRYDKISVCDTYGKHLAECIKAGPTVIHNNVDELQKSIKVNLSNQEEILDFLNSLYSAGIKQSYLTDAGKVFYSSNFDFHFKVKPPEVNSLDSTGSGDSFTAGIIYGWYKDLTFEEGLKLATSLGAVNASRFDISNVTFNDIDKLMQTVDVIPVGKKMKTLDVSPR